MGVDWVVAAMAWRSPQRSAPRLTEPSSVPEQAPALWHSGRPPPQPAHPLQDPAEQEFCQGKGHTLRAADNHFYRERFCYSGGDRDHLHTAVTLIVDHSTRVQRVPFDDSRTCTADAR